MLRVYKPTRAAVKRLRTAYRPPEEAMRLCGLMSGNLPGDITKKHNKRAVYNLEVCTSRPEPLWAKPGEPETIRLATPSYT